MSLQDLNQRFCVLTTVPLRSLKRSPRRGSGHMLTVLALPALLGVSALAVDLGLMGVAAQRVQHVADLAALGGATRITDQTAAVATADETTETNNSLDVMVVEGSRFDASGVLFAPYGGLQFQGSPMHIYHIGLVADTVTLLGGGMVHDGPATALVANETSGAKLVL